MIFEVCECHSPVAITCRGRAASCLLTAHYWHVQARLTARVPAESPAAVWAVFLLLTVLHIYANVQAMRSLHLASLNPARLDILVRHALQQVGLSAGHQAHA